MPTRTEGEMTNLKRMRLARGLAQEDVGAMLDTSYMSIWRWETNRCEPKLRSIRGLERIFGRPIEELLAPESERADVT